MANAIPLTGDRAAFNALNYPSVHANDIDGGTDTIHHTLGGDHEQAAPGDHSHYLDDLLDVDIAPGGTPLADGDVLVWSSALGKWTNGEGGGGTGGGSSGGNGITDPTFHAEGLLVATTDINGVYICPRTATISAVYIYCRTSGTSGTTTIDVNKNGVTIFTTQANRPALAWNDGDKVAKSGTPNIINLAENDVLSVDIDGVAVGARDLTVIVAMSSVSGGVDFDDIVKKRQGNNTDDWNAAGATDFDILPAEVPVIQVGACRAIIYQAQLNGWIRVTWPIAFAHKPLVYLTAPQPYQDWDEASWYFLFVDATATYGDIGVVVETQDNVNDRTIDINWMAIGPTA